MIEILEKECRLCKEILPASEFYRNSNGKNGLHSRCKPCARESSRVASAKYAKTDERREYMKGWVRDNKEHLKKWRIKNLYGLSPESYDALPKICSICESTEKRLVIDHCHETGEVRGLLCFGCNSALGNFRDSQIIIQRAIEYLQSPPLREINLDS